MIRTQQDIIKSWNATNSDPLVSICCVTYNHELYIEKTIQGILEQETSFPFEILIHDDASTDKTTDIIKNYHERYPLIVKPIFQIENQYAKNIKPNITYNYPRAKGRFIAICDGDDYWDDPEKIQIQADFLEKNPNYVCCYHDVNILRDNELLGSRLKISQKKNYDRSKLKKLKCHIAVQSIMFRNVIHEFPIQIKFVKNVDTFLVSLLGKYGDGAYIQKIRPAIYRIHDSGIWSKKSIQEQNAMQIMTWYWLSMFYDEEENSNLSDYFRTKCMTSFLSSSKRYVFLIADVIFKYSLTKILRVFRNLYKK